MTAYDRTVDDLFVEALSRGTGVALQDEQAALTGPQVLARARALAHALRVRGVSPGSIVAIDVQRGNDLVIAQLGVLLAGAAQLALDPDDPDERRTYMLKDSRAALLLTESERQLTGPPRLQLDAVDWSEQAIASHRLHGPTDPAYIIYTSGSTGSPKASVTSHAALVSRLTWLQDEFQLAPDDSVLYKTACGFDVSVAELYWPVTAGARLLCAPPGAQRDPDFLARAVNELGVTVVHFVPSLLDLFLLGRPSDERYERLRLVLAGGEALAPDLVRRFYARSPGRLVNMYGPSECAVYSTYWSCPTDPALDRVLIGGPVADTELLIVDQGTVVDVVGGEGELWIGGSGLADGYLGRPELTRDKFVQRPAGAPSSAGDRWYRSGDLVRRVAPDLLEYLGRLDRQIKVRGNRVELGEVEAVLLQVPMVTAAALVATEAGADPVQLHAFLCVLPEADVTAVATAARGKVERDLPSYMRPQGWYIIDEMPLTANGKLDLARLEGMLAAGDAAPRPEAEVPDQARSTREALLAAWAAATGVAEPEMTSDFFLAGGDSFAAVRLVRRVSSQCGVRLPVRLLFENPVLADFLSAVDQHLSRQTDVGPQVRT